jgi:aminopeptidase N
MLLFRMPPARLTVLWFCLLLFAVQPLQSVAADIERLPTTVAPSEYDLHLCPDAEHLRFRGQVKITLDVKEPTTEIVLNADELVLHRALLDEISPAQSITVDAKLQRATLRFPKQVPPGQHSLAIDYHGTITRSTAGFFAMDYDSPAGHRRTIATNFEPAAERRFMPSWDEPSFKAKFKLTADVPSDLTAVSNMPVESSEAITGGKRRVHFRASPKMSTYLYFVGIGDFERISSRVDGIDVGVVLNRGNGAQGQFALHEAVNLLHFYNGYFGVKYPLPKLDLVVAPGELGTVGAMENWGAILYVPSTLLVDEKLSTPTDRRRVFTVVAHEMSHQWFGDLVTMDWWNDLWLNEGFASWMERKAADELHPDWQEDLDWALGSDDAKTADSRRTTHPIVQPVQTASEAADAFDAITYGKGSAVITMLEAYAGPEAFRNGVRRYMDSHAYGNTADADFWAMIQAASSKPILEMERDFTRQPGLPLVSLEEVQKPGGKTAFELSQSRFVLDRSSSASLPPQRWHIPLNVVTGNEPTSVLLAKDADVRVEADKGAPVVINSGQQSYVRVQYPPSLISTLKAEIATLPAVDQIGILSDAWALGKAGYSSVVEYLELAQRVPDSANPRTWLQIARVLRDVDWYYGPSHSLAFRNYACQRLRPIAARLGWVPDPNEQEVVSSLRDAVLSALSQLGDPEVIAEANQQLERALDSESNMPAAMRDTVITIAGEHADRATFERLLGNARATKDSLRKEALYRSISRVDDPDLAAQAIAVTLEPAAPSGFTPWTLWTSSKKHPDLAWKQLCRLLREKRLELEPMARGQLVPEIATNSADPNRPEELRAIAKEQNISERDVQIALDEWKTNSQFRSRCLPQIDAWLKGREQALKDSSKAEPPLSISTIAQTSAHK